MLILSIQDFDAPVEEIEESDSEEYEEIRWFRAVRIHSPWFSWAKGDPGGSGSGGFTNEILDGFLITHKIEVLRRT